MGFVLYAKLDPAEMLGQLVDKLLLDGSAGVRHDEGVSCARLPQKACLQS